MKTVLRVKDKSRCKKRESLIREALKLGFEPFKVSDEAAELLTSDGHVYAPKSLIKAVRVGWEFRSPEHFIDTKVVGSKLRLVWVSVTLSWLPDIKI